MFLSIRWSVLCCLFGAVGVGALPPLQSSAAETDVVCLYDAMEAEQVTVRFIAINGSKSNVVFTNLTEEAIAIRLPDAVVAVPASNADDESADAIRGRRDLPKVESQAVGGAFQATRRGSRSVAEGSGAVLKLPPKKTKRMTATTVGLEFGKAVPNARVEYALVRPETKVNDPRLMELFRQLGSQQVNPFIGQAIAWHLTDDKSWNELSHGGSNSRTISNYLTSSSDNECGFCPLTLNAANNWVTQYDSLASSNVDSSIEHD